MSDVSAVFSNIEFRIRREKIFVVIHNDNKEYKNNYQIQFEFRNSDYQNHNFQLHLQYCIFTIGIRIDNDIKIIAVADNMNMNMNINMNIRSQ